MDAEIKKHRRKARWLIVFALLLIMMALVEIFRSQRVPENAQQVYYPVQQVDCGSCRWSLSYAAFAVGDTDRALSLLTAPKSLSIWTLPMAYQSSQLSRYKTLPSEGSSEIRLWGVTVKKKQTVRPMDSEQSRSARLINAYYRAVLEQLA